MIIYIWRQQWHWTLKPKRRSSPQDFKIHLLTFHRASHFRECLNRRWHNSAASGKLEDQAREGAATGSSGKRRAPRHYSLWLSSMSSWFLTPNSFSHPLKTLPSLLYLVSQTENVDQFQDQCNNMRWFFSCCAYNAMKCWAGSHAELLMHFMPLPVWMACIAISGHIGTHPQMDDGCRQYDG